MTGRLELFGVVERNISQIKRHILKSFLELKNVSEQKNKALDILCQIFTDLDTLVTTRSMINNGTLEKSWYFTNKNYAIF